MDNQALLALAYQSKENAYVPYSKFKVGAAILGTSGKVFTGCNVESASFGASNCAERTAVFKAISEGERKFAKIAIASSSQKPTFPCGICRQVLMEFGQDMDVIVGESGPDPRIQVYKLKDLLPHAFTGEEL